MTTEAPSGFRNIKPMTREERRALVDKVLLWPYDFRPACYLCILVSLSLSQVLQFLHKLNTQSSFALKCTNSWYRAIVVIPRRLRWKGAA